MGQEFTMIQYRYRKSARLIIFAPETPVTRPNHLKLVVSNPRIVREAALRAY